MYCVSDLKFGKCALDLGTQYSLRLLDLIAISRKF